MKAKGVEVTPNNNLGCYELFYKFEYQGNCGKRVYFLKYSMSIVNPDTYL